MDHMRSSICCWNLLKLISMQSYFCFFVSSFRFFILCFSTLCWTIEMKGLRRNDSTSSRIAVWFSWYCYDSSFNGCRSQRTQSLSFYSSSSRFSQRSFSFILSFLHFLIQMHSFMLMWLYVGCVEVVEVLLKEKADPNVSDRLGMTPLHLGNSFSFSMFNRISSWKCFSYVLDWSGTRGSSFLCGGVVERWCLSQHQDYWWLYTVLQFLFHFAFSISIFFNYPIL